MPPGFRKLEGYRALPALVAALCAHDAQPDRSNGKLGAAQDAAGLTKLLTTRFRKTSGRDQATPFPEKPEVWLLTVARRNLVSESRAGLARQVAKCLV